MSYFTTKFFNGSQEVSGLNPRASSFYPRATPSHSNHNLLSPDVKQLFEAPWYTPHPAALTKIQAYVSNRFCCVTRRDAQLLELLAPARPLGPEARGCCSYCYKRSPKSSRHLFKDHVGRIICPLVGYKLAALQTYRDKNPIYKEMRRASRLAGANCGYDSTRSRRLGLQSSSKLGRSSSGSDLKSLCSGSDIAFQSLEAEYYKKLQDSEKIYNTKSPREVLSLMPVSARIANRSNTRSVSDIMKQDSSDSGGTSSSNSDKSLHMTDSTSSKGGVSGFSNVYSSFDSSSDRSTFEQIVEAILASNESLLSGLSSSSNSKSETELEKSSAGSSALFKTDSENESCQVSYEANKSSIDSSSVSTLSDSDIPQNNVIKENDCNLRNNNSSSDLASFRALVLKQTMTAPFSPKGLTKVIHSLEEFLCLNSRDMVYVSKKLHLTKLFAAIRARIRVRTIEASKVVNTGNLTSINSILNLSNDTIANFVASGENFKGLRRVLYWYDLEWFACLASTKERAVSDFKKYYDSSNGFATAPSDGTDTECSSTTNSSSFRESVGSDVKNVISSDLSGGTANAKLNANAHMVRSRIETGLLTLKLLDYFIDNYTILKVFESGDLCPTTGSSKTKYVLSQMDSLIEEVGVSSQLTLKAILAWDSSGGLGYV